MNLIKNNSVILIIRFIWYSCNSGYLGNELTVVPSKGYLRYYLPQLDALHLHRCNYYFLEKVRCVQVRPGFAHQLGTKHH